MANLSGPFPELSDAPLDALPDGLIISPAYDLCRNGHAARGFATLDEIFALASIGFGGPDRITARARKLISLFNGGATAQGAIGRASRIGDGAAANVLAWAALHGLDHLPAAPLAQSEANALLAQLQNNPDDFLNRSAGTYPVIDETGGAWGFDAAWVTDRLAAGRERMAAFSALRRGEIAVLVGNGPSLRNVDPAIVHGTDVFLSNYALRDPGWRMAARGVAVTNRLVATQEPALFGLSDLWRFHPVWLGHELADSPRTVWLNAVGGPLFFSSALDRQVAWHATVTYFWLQILFHAGYRRVVMIGVDHSYQQPAGIAEGAVLRQDGEDLNHFLPGYFRDRLWQAADTDHMGRTYTLARQVYEADGRELINSTDGGALELLPRRPLRDALCAVT